jgi:hypothetical protein
MSFIHARAVAPDFDQIQNLARAGWNGREIAVRLGCSYPSLRVLCQRARISLKSGETLPPLAKPERAVASHDDTMHFWLSSDAVKRLRAEARHRVTSPDRLAAHLLWVVVSDQLFDAILPDARAPQRAVRGRRIGGRKRARLAAVRRPGADAT